MSKSSSSSSSVSWSVDADNLIDTEKMVFKTNVGLVISTALVTAVYSYFGIDSNVNNAVSRSLLMALSTFISASISDLLQNNGLVYNCWIKQCQILGSWYDSIILLWHNNQTICHP